MPIPNIQIEILSINSDQVTAAFYYAVPVANQLASAASATRMQFGTRLDAPSLAALQAGTVYGEVVSRSLVGIVVSTQSATLLQSEYAAFAAQALLNYAGKYTNLQYLGKAFDGTLWS